MNTKIDLYNGDCLEIMKDIPDNSAVWNNVGQSYPNKRGQYLCVCKYEDGEYWYDILLFSDENDSLFNQGNEGFYGYNSEYGYYLNNNIIAWMDIPEYKETNIERSFKTF